MQMNEPQIWTLIGVFAAFMLGSLTLSIRQNDRMITSLRSEISARFEGMDARFEGIDAKFEGIDARLESMDARFAARFSAIDLRLEELDREVANLATRFWGSR